MTHSQHGRAGRVGLAGLAALALVAWAARAQTGPAADQRDQIEGFQRAYATSFFVFDACADAIAGRAYRAALAERFAQCPFSEAAAARFRAWSSAQRRQSADRIAQMIEEHGGLLVKLDGMTQTCHERNSTLEYTAYRERLLQYAARQAPAGDVVAEPCLPQSTME